MKLNHKKHFIFVVSLLASAIVFPIGLGDWITSGSTTVFDFNANGPYVCHIGDTYYRQIGKAIEDATSGQTIDVIPGNTNRNSKYYTILPSKGNKLEIKKGVKLSIPYEEGKESSKKASSQDAGGALTQRNAFCKSSIILGDNITLENYGTIEIGGILTAPGGSNPTGRTGGNYAELMLGSGSKLINYNLIDVYGLLGEKRESDYSFINNYKEPLVTLIQANQSSDIKPQLNMPMCWYDFCGGTTLKAVYDEIDEKECLPLDDFFFENVTAKMEIHSGSTVKSWVNLYAAKVFGEYDLTLVSSDDSGIISLKDSNSYMVAKYSENTRRSTLDLYNSATFNAFTIDVKKAIIDTAGEPAWWAAAALGIPSQVSSKDGIFPISHHFSISLRKENEGTGIFNGSSNQYKLMNGSSLYVSKGATLTAKTLAVYKGDDIITGKSGLAANIIKCENNTTPAKVIINGSLSGATVAGKIDSEEEGATIEITSKCSIKTYEPKSSSRKWYQTSDHMTGWFEIDLYFNAKNNAGNYVKQSSIKTYTSKKGNGFYFFE